MPIRISKTDCVQTPKFILNQLKAEFGVDTFFDPCPYKKKFDPKIHTNGLVFDWPQDQIVFVNPPFSKMKHWVKKCYEQWKLGCKVILLTKLDCLATRYTQRYICNAAETRICRNYVQFPGYNSVCIFKIVLCIYKNKSSNILKIIELINK